MDLEVENLVNAVYQDLRRTYRSLTRDWLIQEAERQLKGEKFTGGPGMILNDYLKKAGFIK